MHCIRVIDTSKNAGIVDALLRNKGAFARLSLNRLRILAMQTDTNDVTVTRHP